MSQFFIEVPRADLDRLSQSPVYFDALIAEDERGCTFRKTLTMDDPGVRSQRVTPRWPHHLPGELIIGLTGQAGVILARRRGIIAGGWRGHGVRIRDARFSAPVLVGETFYVRVELRHARRFRDNVHVRFTFRMWKHEPGAAEIEVYRSEQDAMFFPG
jgi:hypothetical protein